MHMRIHTNVRLFAPDVTNVHVHVQVFYNLTYLTKPKQLWSYSVGQMRIKKLIEICLQTISSDHHSPNSTFHI